MYPSPLLRRVWEFVRGYSRVSSSLNRAKTYLITFRHVRLDSIRFERPQRTAEAIFLQRLLNISDAPLTSCINLYSKYALNNVYFALSASEFMLLRYLKYITPNSVALVRERTIPTERPPPVGEVSANFCG